MKALQRVSSRRFTKTLTTCKLLTGFFCAGRSVIKTIGNSRFHWLFTGEPGGPREPWDRELFSSPSFAVVPSLGSLVPGWLLIVPRRPMISLRELKVEERKEIDQLINEVASRAKIFGGELFAFEHGSGHRGSKMGCGVDQAHLHVVPLEFDLVDWALSQSGDAFNWTQYSELLLTDLPATGEYISVWNVSSRGGAVASVTKSVSQWMRRAIATKLGVDEDWDYRTNPQMENITKTVDAIRRTRLLTM